MFAVSRVWCGKVLHAEGRAAEKPRSPNLIRVGNSRLLWYKVLFCSSLIYLTHAIWSAPVLEPGLSSSNLILNPEYSSLNEYLFIHLFLSKQLSPHKLRVCW